MLSCINHITLRYTNPAQIMLLTCINNHVIKLVKYINYGIIMHNTVMIITNI